MFYEPRTTSKRTIFVLCFIMLGIIACVLIFTGVISTSYTYKKAFIYSGAALIAISVIGAVYGCLTHRFDIDDLPMRIREDIGIV